MAIHKSCFFSTSLKREVNFNLIIPTKDFKDIMSGNLEYESAEYPLVVLLHGSGDNQDAWLNNTNVVEYANQYKVAVVMPSAENSYYTDTTYGLNMKSFIENELISYVRAYHPVSSKCEDTYIIGNSMGAYGALKIGLSNSDKFGNIACFSGGLDVVTQFQSFVAQIIDFPAVFGDLETVRGSKHDNLHLVAELDVVPSLYITCGAQDFNLQSTENFINLLVEKGITHTYKKEDGSHGWKYWDKQLANYFELKFNEPTTDR